MHDDNFINDKESQLRQQLSSLTVIDHGVKIAASPEYVYEHMYAAVVNTDSNKNLLSHCPHESIANLSVIAKSDIGDGRSILVTDDFTQLLRLSAEEIIEHAKANTLHEGYTCSNLAQTVNEMIAQEFTAGNPDLLPPVTNRDEPFPVYIITTPRVFDGASVIASKVFMDEIHARLDGDYYVLPSSRHEVLVIQADKAPSVEELKEMVTSVNATEVMESDWLSDDVYYYDGKHLTIADSLAKAAETDYASKLAQPEYTQEQHVMHR